MNSTRSEILSLDSYVELLEYPIQSRISFGIILDGIRKELKVCKGSGSVALGIVGIGGGGER